MSYEELDRVRVIERVIEKRLTQGEAARMLGLTSRQVRRGLSHPLLIFSKRRLVIGS